jgi:hypothetical protein
MSVRSYAVVAVAAALLLPPALAQEEKPASRPTKGDDKPDAPKKDDAKKDDAKKDEPAGPPSGAKKPAPDLVPLSPELDKTLEPFATWKEPKREAVRVVASLLDSVLHRDLEKTLLHYHKDFQTHLGEGKLEPTPPAKLREILKGLPSRPETKLTIAKLLVLDSVRVYTKEEALADEGQAFRKNPKAVAEAGALEKDDLVFLAKTRPPRTWSGHDGEDEVFEHEIFYALRRDGERLKVVIGE